MSEILQLQNLEVKLRRGDRQVPVLDHLDLTVSRGEMLALVGESGSGKTIAALAVLRLLPKDMAVSGTIRLDGRELTKLDEAAMRRIRGRDVGMVFQNPLSALNPSRTITAQIEEAWRTHNEGGRKLARARALDLLAEVGVPTPAKRLDDYPHQFSGGMRQRVMIAMALACNPKLLIADEPTTGLDPLVAKQIMVLIARLQREHDMGVLFVTHDFSIVEEYADAIHVLYAGRSVERGEARQFFVHPRHPYSEALLGSVARIGQARLQNIPGTMPDPGSRPPGCRFAPRCGYRKAACEIAYPEEDRAEGSATACLFPLPARSKQAVSSAPPAAPFISYTSLLELTDVCVRYAGGVLERRPPFTALADVTLRLGQGECLGVVGESGSGKSTLGRAVLQMIDYEGRITLDGQDFHGLRARERRRLRQRIQVVFQDPRESLNPRLRVKDAIAEPLHIMRPRSGPVAAQVTSLLRRVGLNPEIGEQYPRNISGGQAQRVAIARALAAAPQIIVLDEPTSALDVSTQAMLLNLLKDLAIAERLSYILISHDFAAVSYMANRIAVLKAGRIVEISDSRSILSSPKSGYTRALVEAAPNLRNLEVHKLLPESDPTGPAT